MSSFLNMVFGGEKGDEKRVEEKKEEVIKSDDEINLEEFSFGDNSDSEAEGAVRKSGSNSDASDISIIADLSILSIDQNEESMLEVEDVKKEDVESTKNEIVSDRMARFRELLERDTQSFANKLMGILKENTESS